MYTKFGVGKMFVSRKSSTNNLKLEEIFELEKT